MLEKNFKILSLVAMIVNGEKDVFQRIIDRELPAEILMEDELCVVIRDINPGAPVHVLIIPKKNIPRLAEAQENDAPVLGHLLLVARKFVENHGLIGGFRVVINNGPDAGESVPHLHVHLLAGKSMIWPPC
ncbi:MAG: histidine triad nucleotide-binding protein [Puniceicoccales bacterium]|jgi:histidine triad (HIT) family protein|nr:histidine triad nucleotide-binding protein [Puniceicoccales bacterium]